MTGSREIQHQAQWTWSPIQICVHGVWRLTWNSMDGTNRELLLPTVTLVTRAHGETNMKGMSRGAGTCADFLCRAQSEGAVRPGRRHHPPSVHGNTKENGSMDDH